MFPWSKTILVTRRAIAATALSALWVLGGCGQRGPLYLPSDASGRASLPETLRPASASTTSSTASSPASAPAPRRAP